MVLGLDVWKCGAPPPDDISTAARLLPSEHALVAVQDDGFDVFECHPDNATVYRTTTRRGNNQSNCVHHTFIPNTTSIVAYFDLDYMDVVFYDIKADAVIARCLSGFSTRGIACSRSMIAIYHFRDIAPPQTHLLTWTGSRMALLMDLPSHDVSISDVGVVAYWREGGGGDGDEPDIAILDCRATAENDAFDAASVRIDIASYLRDGASGTTGSGTTASRTTGSSTNSGTTGSSTNSGIRRSNRKRRATPPLHDDGADDAAAAVKGQVKSFTISPCGRLLAVDVQRSDRRRLVLIFDVNTKTAIISHRMRVRTARLGMLFSPDSQLLLFQYSRVVLLCDLRSTRFFRIEVGGRASVSFRTISGQNCIQVARVGSALRIAKYHAAVDNWIFIQ